MKSPHPNLIPMGEGIIRKKIVLLKISGKAIEDLMTKNAWIKTIRNLKNIFDAVIIVHGAGNLISEWCRAMGYETEFYEGQRITDKKTMEVVAAVQSGLLNAKIVSRLQTNKINAIGLTGIDNGLFTAEYFDENSGYVGTPVLTGNMNWLHSIMGAGIVPVFSSICRDMEGNLMNVNADIFTKALAIAISADTVLFLSDIDGVKSGGALRMTLNSEDINYGILKGEITDGMIPKLKSCTEMIEKGIKRVWIGRDLINFSDINIKGTLIVESKSVTV